MARKVVREHWEIVWRRVRNVETALARFARDLADDGDPAHDRMVAKSRELVGQLSDFRTLLVDYLQAPVEQEESDA